VVLAKISKMCTDWRLFFGDFVGCKPFIGEFWGRCVIQGIPNIVEKVFSRVRLLEKVEDRLVAIGNGVTGRDGCKFFVEYHMELGANGAGLDVEDQADGCRMVCRKPKKLALARARFPFG
jgi:hypothetical protein